jgi:hypothetical protein
LRGGFLSGASGALSSFSRHVDVDCCSLQVSSARLNRAALWRGRSV